MNIMPLMTDAIMADCGYMPNAVFGAYMKMLIAWWRAEAKPMSAARLRMIAGCSEDEFAVIAEHLTETPEGFVQKKLVETFARQSDRSEKAKEKAQHRWSKPTSNAAAHAAADAVAMPQQCNPLTMNQDSISDDMQSVERASAPRKRATRLPADWLIPPDWIEDATRLGFSEAEARNEADRFRDYWIARGGEAAAKLDWRATWRNWCRNANERRPRAPHANGGSRGGYGKPVDPVEIRNRIQRELADREALPGDGRQLRSVGVG